MTDTYFLDTNILMYAVGTDHPLKAPSLEILERASRGEISVVTDAEVFQEVAYRYWSQKKWALAVEVLEDYEPLFDEIFPVTKGHLKDYYSLLTDYDSLSPRDAIHVAVMKALHLEKICTTDQAFKKIPYLKVCFPL